MKNHNHDNECGRGCDCGCNRRDFLTASASGAMAMTLLTSITEAADTTPDAKEKKPAVIRAAFLYPPSKSFAKDPDAWWSWPGNEFDAEGRHKKYAAELAKMERRLGVTIVADDKPIASQADAVRLAREIQTDKPDGLLLIMFYDKSLSAVDFLLKVAEEAEIPAVFYTGLEVKHGSVDKYSRPGVYFIQSLDNIEAIEAGVRMFNTRKRMGQSRLLSVTETKTSREVTEPFFGIKVKVTPVQRYIELFSRMPINESAKHLIGQITRFSKKYQGITREALENAARAHLAVKQLLADENADGLAMNCPRRGMLQPCISFATLNSQLIPATCENDLPALCTQLLGQLLLGRPGFQHNPAYDTEKNHYYASHCTCPPNLHGPQGKQLPYVLRRYAHTNEGSCAIQVFWKPNDPVTMVHYYPGKKPSLDVYAGRVIESHPAPKVAGCTTNVEIRITDRPDARMVQGHHNILFCGDFARRFRMFAQLYKLPLKESG